MRKIKSTLFNHLLNNENELFLEFINLNKLYNKFGFEIIYGNRFFYGVKKYLY